MPDLIGAYSNGSLCVDYVTNYVAFVSVESPTTSVIMSMRDKRY